MRARGRQRPDADTELPAVRASDAARWRDAGPYALEYQGRWVLDGASVENAWTTRTRAVLAVSPNNPTGSCLSRVEQNLLSKACATRGAALILDEVFADYWLTTPQPSEEKERADGEVPCLTFRLGGLSKSVGLPQAKLGWLCVEGPDVEVREALSRLEFICDAYLRSRHPCRWLRPRSSRVVHRCAVRFRSAFVVTTTACGSGCAPPCARSPRRRGWMVRGIACASSHERRRVVLELLDRDNVVVHPGFFFDFPREAFLVVSLLPPGRVFEEGITRIANRLTLSGDDHLETSTLTTGPHASAYSFPCHQFPRAAAGASVRFRTFRACARWLARAGMTSCSCSRCSRWSTRHNSPYAALTAMAIDPVFLGLADQPDFVEAGGEDAFSAEARDALVEARNAPVVNYAAVRAREDGGIAGIVRTLHLAWNSTPHRMTSRHSCNATAWWLDDYALFRALHDENGGRYWRDWDAGVARPRAMTPARRTCALVRCGSLLRLFAVDCRRAVASGQT